MKCPKCGYNSFEYLDSCKKCNADLVGFKASHGILPTILPARELVTGGAAEAAAHGFTPAPAAASMQESEEFSWEESNEESAASSGALPSLGLDLPPPEPDHFNFNLDLPPAEAGSAPESTPDEFPFEGFGNDGNDFLLGNEPANDAPAAQDEPAAQTEETPFGELSFEDTYSAKEEEPAPAAAVAAEETALPDFFAPAGEEAPLETASESAFDGLFELEGTAVEAPDFPQDEAGSPGTEPFLNDESTPADAAGDDADLMGLSPEEYESLFGEAPKKKGAASKPAEG